MKKFIKSFTYAINGIRTVFGKERNMNIHLIMATAVIVCAIIFHISGTEWLVCLLCIALVISLEMLNSAIERIVNIISPQINPQAGQIKDIAAGAVLVSVIISAIIGLIIFVPKAIDYVL